MQIQEDIACLVHPVLQSIEKQSVATDVFLKPILVPKIYFEAHLGLLINKLLVI